MRLLMTADAVGGVWQYALELAGALPQVKVVLALLGPAPGDAQLADAAALPNVALVHTGLALDWLAPDPGVLDAAAATLAALAAEYRVDCVQLNQPALAARAAFDVPVLAVAHSCVATWWNAVKGGEPPVDFAWQIAATGAGLGRADAVVCPSHAFADALRTRYALPAAPHVVHNGRAPRAHDAVRPQPFAFTAGRLWDEGKNVALLDQVAARIPVPFRAAGPAQGPHGSGVALAHLQLLGNLDEAGMASVLAERPVFVSAARYEPFGLAVLEAAHAGCALVLSDIPTFRELWDDVATFVAPDDAAGFAAAVERLMADPAQRTARGLAAQVRAARYTPHRMAQGMSALYDTLLQTAPGRVAA